MSRENAKNRSRMTKNFIFHIYNRTWVNDLWMAAGSSGEHTDGDTIRVGYSLFRVVYPEAASDVEQDPIVEELTKVSPLEEVATTLVADVRGFSAYSPSHPSSVPTQQSSLKNGLL